MSVQTKLARQQRFKGTIVIINNRPKENALGLYTGNTSAWSPIKAIFPRSPGSASFLKSPRSVLSPTNLRFSTSAHGHQAINKLIKPRPREPEQQDVVQVYDDVQKTPEAGKALQIQALAGGMGVAVTGRYRSRPAAHPRNQSQSRLPHSRHHRSTSAASGMAAAAAAAANNKTNNPSEPRYDSFLAHLVEGRMQDTLKRLISDVDAAQKQGLRDVRMLVLYRDEKSLAEDPRMVWTRRMVASEAKLRERLVGMLEEELGATPALQAYHVLDEKALGITAADRDFRIQNV
ncbi:hypothetical protein BD289DRAFT_209734 [Coniella lustricola]|uniref:Uncharacterized protein n=1 Tax=Coniella lustricola TaxID=2025994 RepID=A0A2T2ZS94_9PEZI|nr:hypothetical protein BD289DRAFT_209734 [Coniella lustricola]